MKALIQRVTEANVMVSRKVIGEIDQGIVALIGVEPEDTQDKTDRLLHKLLNYRIFSDDEGKMNRSLIDIQGGLLLISQFTLAADTKKGLRPSFTSAAPPEQGEILFNYLVSEAQKTYPLVQCGEFGADMKVSLINDGPVTFMLTV